MNIFLRKAICLFLSLLMLVTPFLTVVTPVRAEDPVACGAPDQYQIGAPTGDSCDAGNNCQGTVYWHYFSTDENGQAFCDKNSCAEPISCPNPDTGTNPNSDNQPPVDQGHGDVTYDDEACLNDDAGTSHIYWLKRFADGHEEKSDPGRVCGCPDNQNLVDGSCQTGEPPAPADEAPPSESIPTFCPDVGKNEGEEYQECFGPGTSRHIKIVNCDYSVVSALVNNPQCPGSEDQAAVEAFQREQGAPTDAFCADLNRHVGETWTECNESAGQANSFRLPADCIKVQSGTVADSTCPGSSTLTQETISPVSDSSATGGASPESASFAIVEPPIVPVFTPANQPVCNQETPILGCLPNTTTLLQGRKVSSYNSQSGQCEETQVVDRLSENSRQCGYLPEEGKIPAGEGSCCKVDQDCPNQGLVGQECLGLNGACDGGHICAEVPPEDQGKIKSGDQSCCSVHSDCQGGQECYVDNGACRSGNSCGPQRAENRTNGCCLTFGDCGAQGLKFNQCYPSHEAGLSCQTERSCQPIQCSGAQYCQNGTACFDVEACNNYNIAEQQRLQALANQRSRQEASSACASSVKARCIVIFGDQHSEKMESDQQASQVCASSPTCQFSEDKRNCLLSFSCPNGGAVAFDGGEVAQVSTGGFRVGDQVIAEGRLTVIKVVDGSLIKVEGDDDFFLESSLSRPAPQGGTSGNFQVNAPAQVAALPPAQINLSPTCQDFGLGESAETGTSVVIPTFAPGQIKETLDFKYICGEDGLWNKVGASDFQTNFTNGLNNNIQTYANNFVSSDFTPVKIIGDKLSGSSSTTADREIIDRALGELGLSPFQDPSTWPEETKVKFANKVAYLTSYNPLLLAGKGVQDLHNATKVGVPGTGFTVSAPEAAAVVGFIAGAVVFGPAAVFIGGAADIIPMDPADLAEHISNASNAQNIARVQSGDAHFADADALACSAAGSQCDGYSDAQFNQLVTSMRDTGILSADQPAPNKNDVGLYQKLLTEYIANKYKQDTPDNQAEVNSIKSGLVNNPEEHADFIRFAVFNDYFKSENEAGQKLTPDFIKTQQENVTKIEELKKGAYKSAAGQTMLDEGGAIAAEVITPVAMSLAMPLAEVALAPLAEVAAPVASKLLRPVGAAVSDSVLAPAVGFGKKVLGRGVVSETVDQVLNNLDQRTVKVVGEEVLSDGSQTALREAREQLEEAEIKRAVAPYSIVGQLNGSVGVTDSINAERAVLGARANLKQTYTDNLRNELKSSPEVVARVSEQYQGVKGIESLTQAIVDDDTALESWLEKAGNHYIGTVSEGLIDVVDNQVKASKLLAEQARLAGDAATASRLTETADQRAARISQQLTAAPSASLDSNGKVVLSEPAGVTLQTDGGIAGVVERAGIQTAGAATEIADAISISTQTVTNPQDGISGILSAVSGVLDSIGLGTRAGTVSDDLVGLAARSGQSVDSLAAQDIPARLSKLTNLSQDLWNNERRLTQLDADSIEYQELATENVSLARRIKQEAAQIEPHLRTEVDDLGRQLTQLDTEIAGAEREYYDAVTTLDHNSTLAASENMQLLRENRSRLEEELIKAQQRSNDRLGIVISASTQAEAQLGPAQNPLAAIVNAVTGGDNRTAAELAEDATRVARESVDNTVVREEVTSARLAAQATEDRAEAAALTTQADDLASGSSGHAELNRLLSEETQLDQKIAEASAKLQAAQKRLGIDHSYENDKLVSDLRAEVAALEKAKTTLNEQLAKLEKEVGDADIARARQTATVVANPGAGSAVTLGPNAETPTSGTQAIPDRPVAVPTAVDNAAREAELRAQARVRDEAARQAEQQAAEAAQGAEQLARQPEVVAAIPVSPAAATPPKKSFLTKITEAIIGKPTEYAVEREVQADGQTLLKVSFINGRSGKLQSFPIAVEGWFNPDESQVQSILKNLNKSEISNAKKAEFEQALRQLKPPYADKIDQLVAILEDGATSKDKKILDTVRKDLAKLRRANDIPTVLDNTILDRASQAAGIIDLPGDLPPKLHAVIVSLKDQAAVERIPLAGVKPALQEVASVAEEVAGAAKARSQQLKVRENALSQVRKLHDEADQVVAKRAALAGSSADTTSLGQAEKRLRDRADEFAAKAQQAKQVIDEIEQQHPGVVRSGTSADNRSLARQSADEYALAIAERDRLATVPVSQEVFDNANAAVAQAKAQADQAAAQVAQDSKNPFQKAWDAVFNRGKAPDAPATVVDSATTHPVTPVVKTAKLSKEELRAQAQNAEAELAAADSKYTEAYQAAEKSRSELAVAYADYSEIKVQGGVVPPDIDNRYQSASSNYALASQRLDSAIDSANKAVQVAQAANQALADAEKNPFQKAWESVFGKKPPANGTTPVNVAPKPAAQVAQTVDQQTSKISVTLGTTRVQGDLKISDPALAATPPVTIDGMGLKFKGQDAWHQGKYSVALTDGVSGATDEQGTVILAQDTARFATNLLDRAVADFNQHGDLGQSIAFINEEVKRYEAGVASRGASVATTLSAAGQFGDKLVTIRVGDSPMSLVRGNQVVELSPALEQPKGFFGKLLSWGKDESEYQLLGPKITSNPKQIGRSVSNPRIDVYQLQEGDKIIIRSDGADSLGIGHVAIGASDAADFQAKAGAVVGGFRLNADGTAVSGIPDDASFIGMFIGKTQTGDVTQQIAGQIKPENIRVRNINNSPTQNPIQKFIAAKPAKLADDAVVIGQSANLGLSKDNNLSKYLITSQDSAATGRYSAVITDGAGSGLDSTDYGTRELSRKAAVEARNIADQVYLDARSADDAANLLSDRLYNMSAQAGILGNQTTIMTAMVVDGKLVAGSFGDSHLYIVRGGKVISLTDRLKTTHFGQEVAPPKVIIEPLQMGDKVFISSDGFPLVRNYEKIMRQAESADEFTLALQNQLSQDLKAFSNATKTDDVVATPIFYGKPSLSLSDRLSKLFSPINSKLPDYKIVRYVPLEVDLGNIVGGFEVMSNALANGSQVVVLTSNRQGVLQSILLPRKFRDFTENDVSAVLDELRQKDVDDKVVTAIGKKLSLDVRENQGYIEAPFIDINVLPMITGYRPSTPVPHVTRNAQVTALDVVDPSLQPREPVLVRGITSETPRTKPLFSEKVTAVPASGYKMASKIYKLADQFGGDQIPAEEIKKELETTDVISPQGFQVKDKVVLTTGENGALTAAIPVGRYALSVHPVPGIEFLGIPEQVIITPKQGLKIFVGVNKFDISQSAKISAVAGIPTNDGKLTIQLFSDQNRNGKRDSGEQLLKWAGVTFLADQQYAFKEIKLLSGWNLIGFSGLPEGMTKASEVIQSINSGGGQATTISRLVSGKWQEYISRGNEVFGKDFKIESGQGYFIRSQAKSTWTIKAKPSEETKVSIKPGWNVISAPASGQAGVDTLLDPQVEKDSLVERFDSGLWEAYLRLSKDIYGNEFSLEPFKGYLIWSRAPYAIQFKQ